MKVPGQVENYEKNVRDAKDLMIRLRKGSKMLEEAFQSQDVIKCLEIISLWRKISEQAFENLETAALVHQQLISKTSVLVKSNGELVKAEEIMNTEAIDIDPFTLHSLALLKEVFGEQYTEMLEIKH